MRKNKKTLAAIIMVIVLACCGCSGEQEDSYRMIQVLEVIGSVTVERSGMGAMDAYDGMRLQSGDIISVAEESWLKIQMDEDKYALVEPNSKLCLEADGDSADSKTVIHLEAGAISNRLENELSEQSSYEVSTPNSTMAVRGTVFRVEVTYGDDGESITGVAVYDGTVESRLVYPDGTTDSESDAVLIVDGTGVRIWGNDVTSDYMGTGLENNLSDLQRNTLIFLQESQKAGSELGISEEELQELIDALENSLEPTDAEYTVTFRYQGKVFATQTVKHNETAEAPMLQPTASGKWDFDFSNGIVEDTTIEWVDSAS